MRSVFLPIFLALFLLSCKSSTSPQTLKEFRIAISEDPQTLDPRKGGDAVSSQIQFMLFEGLTQLHPDGSVSLAQADDLAISDDQKTYTFYLGNTTWSNGDVVTAYEFADAWKSILDPSFPSPNAHLLYPIQGALEAKKGIIPLSDVGIKAINAKQLVITLHTPTPYFLELISFCVFFPVHHELPLLSNGPFILDEWKRQNKLSLKKNPNYHAFDQVGIDQIDIDIISSETTALHLYEQEKLDFIGHPFSSLGSQEIALVKESLHKIPAAATTLIALNIHHPILQNIHIRKALAYALNRNQIIEHLSIGSGTVATRLIPNMLQKKSLPDYFLDNNESLALFHLQEGMNELNITLEDLEDIPLFYSRFENNHKMAQVLQQQWKATLGITFPLQSLESKTLLSKLNSHDYGMGLTMWRAQFYDPMSILERFKHAHYAKNYSGWENTLFQELLNESALVPSYKRTCLLQQAEELLMDEFVVIPIHHWNLTFLHKDHVKNIAFSPVGGIFFERLIIDLKTEKK